MLRLSNGARVIRADIRDDGDMYTGYVFARSDRDLVVWNVMSDNGETWHAYGGDYYPLPPDSDLSKAARDRRMDARERAIGRYDTRRGAV